MDEHPGVVIARRYLDEFNHGDLQALGNYYTDDIVWRVGGNHPLSGTYRGRQSLLDYFNKARELTAGTMTLEPDSILASDQHTAMFTRVRAQRNGKTLDVVLAQILTRGPNGRWSEYWALADDQDAVDSFWSEPS